MSSKKVTPKNNTSKVSKETDHKVDASKLKNNKTAVDDGVGVVSKAKDRLNSGWSLIEEFGGNAAHVLSDTWNSLYDSAANITGLFKGKKPSDRINDKTTSKSDLNLAFSYSQYMTTAGIMGLPPKFNYLADLRLFQHAYSEDGGQNGSMMSHSDADPLEGITSTSYGENYFSPPYQGAKWIEVYLKYANLVFFEIGKPIFLHGISDEARQAILASNTGDSQVSIAVQDDVQKAAEESASMMIVFQSAGTEYAQGVSLLCNGFATFLDLEGSAVLEQKNSLSRPSKDRISNGKVLPVYTNTQKEDKGNQYGINTYRSFWGIQDFTDDETEIEDANNIKGLMSKSGNYVVGGYGRHDLDDYTNDIFAENMASTICFYTNGGIEVPLTVTHSTGPSSLLSTVTQNAISDTVAEVAFLADDFDFTKSFVDQGTYEANDGVLGWVKKLFGIIKVGAKLIAPEVWKGSDSEKSFEITIILQATAPQRQCIYKEILVPLAHILETTMPRNVTSGSSAMLNKLGAYAPPYVMRTYSRGSVNSNLALPTSITITKRPGDMTVDGLPTRVEVTMTIKDLYGTMGVPMREDAKTLKATRLKLTQCLGLTEYMAAMTGVVISQEKTRLMFVNAVLNSKDKKQWVMNIPKRWAGKIQNSLFAGYNSRVNAAVGWTIQKINRIT